MEYNSHSLKKELLVILWTWCLYVGKRWRAHEAGVDRSAEWHLIATFVSWSERYSAMIWRWLLMNFTCSVSKSRSGEIMIGRLLCLCQSLYKMPQEASRQVLSRPYIALYCNVLQLLLIYRALFCVIMCASENLRNVAPGLHRLIVKSLSKSLC